MPPRHRPYRPKVKGCYECSQRRISCDRTAPHCMKCVSRGLQCSGLDLRYRFAEGVAIRGRWAGEPVKSFVERRHLLAEWKEGQAKQTETHRTDNLQARQPNCNNEKERPKVSSVTDLNSLRLPALQTSVTRLHEMNDVPNSSACVQRQEAFHTDTQAERDEAFTDSFQPRGSIFGMVHEPLPDNVLCWKRTLLKHYSEHIAPEMMAFDGPHNGWRYIILPIAHADGLVMDAVLTVSAFHISLQESQSQTLDRGPFKPTTGLPRVHRMSPESLYERTIQGLKQRRDWAESTFEAKQSIIVTILVLLTLVMVNGRNDFPILFSMLDAASNVLGGEKKLGGSELGDFLIRQVRKLRVYSSPFISEHVGLETLSSPSRWESVFDCLRYCSQRLPEHAENAVYVEDICQQAHDIYLRQVYSDSAYGQTETFESISRLEQFRSSLEAFPTGSPGKQVLIWATFIAASDCILEEHKTFFENTLLENYNRSKFVNLLKGIAQLRYIWARRSEGVRWTHLLPQAQLLLM